MMTSLRDIHRPLAAWKKLKARYDDVTALLLHVAIRFMRRDLNLSGANKLGNRPSLEEVCRTFSSVKMAANVGATSVTFFLVVVWPASMLAEGVFDYQAYSSWVGADVT